MGRLARALWGIVIVDIVMIFVVAAMPLRAESIVSALISLALICLTFWGATTGLTIVYRWAFAHWQVWLGLIGTFLLGGAVSQGGVTIPQSGLSLLCTILFPLSAWSLLIGIVLNLWQHDIGLQLAAWMTVICVWGAVIAWRWGGNTIEAMFQLIMQPGRAAFAWWFNVLLLWTCCLVLLALLSAAGHTFVLLRREYWRLPPSVHKRDEAGDIRIQ